MPARLLAGRDMIKQLRGKLTTNLLLVPGVALREGAFVDDVTVGDVGTELGVRAFSAGASPLQLLNAVGGGG